MLIPEMGYGPLVSEKLRFHTLCPDLLATNRPFVHPAAWGCDGWSVPFFVSPPSKLIWFSLVRKYIFKWSHVPTPCSFSGV